MSPKKVLVIDDARETGRLIASAIATLDPSLLVKSYGSAEEALVELFSQGADLLVIDIRLPGLTGLELTRRVRARDQAVRIVQISGVTNPQAREQALSAGANAFFPKPIATSEFLHAIAQMLGIKPPAPPEVAAHPSKDAKAARINDLLTGLRKSLGASLVLLMNEQGRAVVQTGAWPDPAAEAAVPPVLLPALAANVKVSQQMGQPSAETVLVYQGSTYQLLVAPVGVAFALLVALKKERSMLRTAIAVEELLAAQKDVAKALGTKAVEVSAAAPLPAPAPVEVPAAVEVEPALPVETLAPAVLPPQEHPDDPRPIEKLAALLSETAAKRLKPAEVNAFWDTATSPEPEELAPGSEVFSYEQAMKLGLTPKETGR